MRIAVQLYDSNTMAGRFMVDRFPRNFHLIREVSDKLYNYKIERPEPEKISGFGRFLLADKAISTIA